MGKAARVFVAVVLVVVLLAGPALAAPGKGKALGKVSPPGKAVVEATFPDSGAGFDKKAVSFEGEKGLLRAKVAEKTAWKNNHLEQVRARVKSLPVAKTGKKFTDVEGHWAETAIERMVALGIIKGYGDGTFRPDAPVTEEELVVLTMAALDTPTGDTEGESDQDLEEEIETAADEENLAGVSAWARSAVHKASQKGIINLNRFHSAVQVTRAQAAVIIARALGLEPADTTEVNFRDGILLDQEELGYIMALVELGILKGTPDGKFNPNRAITRAELAAILDGILFPDEEEAVLGEGDIEEGVSESLSEAEPEDSGAGEEQGGEETGTAAPATGETEEEVE